MPSGVSPSLCSGSHDMGDPSYLLADRVAAAEQWKGVHERVGGDGILGLGVREGLARGPRVERSGVGEEARARILRIEGEELPVARANEIAEEDFGALGDTSTLAEPAVVEDLIENRMNRG